MLFKRHRQETVRCAGGKKTPCSVWAGVMLAAVCEISSPFGSCVDETATRADVYNHVLNKYWTENNKKGRTERKGDRMNRNLFILFSNAEVSRAAAPCVWFSLRASGDPSGTDTKSLFVHDAGVRGSSVETFEDAFFKTFNASYLGPLISLMEAAAEAEACRNWEGDFCWCSKRRSFNLHHVYSFDGVD